MQPVAAIIGGTGIGDRLASLGGRPFHVPTSEGMMRSRLVEIGGREVVLLKRHSSGHKVPPHKVNYKAMALGLRQLGVKFCFASAAVGSLRDDWPCGTIAVCDDFLDVTFRNQTLFDREVVHTDFSTAFGSEATHALLAAGSDLGEIIHHAVYFCGNGPRYETPFEIDVYRKLGGDVVGMTAATEAILMREAGVGYACLSVVTNFACGISPTPLNHEEVVEEMERSGARAVSIFIKAVENLP